MLFLIAACGGATSGGDDTGDDAPPRGLALPQALGGAFAANPDVYPEIPVHVVVDGEAAAVTVAVGGEAVAAEPDGDGWIARVPIAALPDGEHVLEASAGGVTATATLVVGRTGRQVTQVGVDGNAGTPRLLEADGRLLLTWTDSRDGTRTARLVELDGAGRFAGEPVALLGRADPVLYARTAAGAGVIAVLFQEPGGPYQNHFAIVTPEGGEVVAPIALDPEGMYGSYGGAVAFDGEAFVLVWRVNDGAGSSHIRWMRVTPAGEVTGPVVVARSGDDDPDGGFDPFTVIGVAAAGERSVVAFTRHRWDAALELTVPACQVTTVEQDGTVGAVELAHPGWYWHHECRLVDGGALLVWGEQDLNDPSSTPPTTLRAARIGADGRLDPARGPGAVMVTAPDHRTEPAVSAGVAAWLDERSYVDLANGRIELWAAPLGDDLAGGEPVVFDHARFIEGTSELGAAAIATNRLLVWIDERHGGGITDPRPEVWIDTAWY